MTVVTSLPKISLSHLKRKRQVKEVPREPETKSITSDRINELFFATKRIERPNQTWHETEKEKRKEEYQNLGSPSSASSSSRWLNTWLPLPFLHDWSPCCMLMTASRLLCFPSSPGFGWSGIYFRWIATPSSCSTITCTCFGNCYSSGWWPWHLLQDQRQVLQDQQ